LNSQYNAVNIYAALMIIDQWVRVSEELSWEMSRGNDCLRISGTP